MKKFVILAKFYNTLWKIFVVLAKLFVTLWKIFVVLAKRLHLFLGISAGAPGPAGQETGTVPGRAGQAGGTSPPPTAQPIRLCGREGRGCRKTYRKKRPLYRNFALYETLHDRQFIEKKRRKFSYRKFLQFYEKNRSFLQKKEIPALVLWIILAFFYHIAPM